MYLENSYRLGSSVRDLTQQLINCDQNYKQFRDKFYQGYRLESQNNNNHPVLVQEFEEQDSEVRWVVEQIYHLQEEGY